MKPTDRNYPPSWTPPSLSPEQQARMRSWIEELRLTKRPQIVGLLAHPATGGRCCLGVLCDLHAAEKGGAWNGDSYQGVICALPIGVATWVGADRHFVLVPSGSYRHAPCSTAAKLNDKAKLTFGEIAEVLEWAYLGGPCPEFYESLEAGEN